MVKKNSQKNITTVSFDIDGTLFSNSFNDYIWEIRIPELFAKKEGISFNEAERFVLNEYRKVDENSLTWSNIFYWFKYFNLNEDPLDIIYRSKNRLEKYKEVDSAIEKLSKNYNLIVFSAAPREFIDIKLNFDSLGTYFSNIFSVASDFRKYNTIHKEPAMYLEICEKIGCKPENLAHVGDSINSDYYNPKSIGINAFFLNRDSKTKIDNEIRNLNELVEKLNY